VPDGRPLSPRGAYLWQIESLALLAAPPMGCMLPWAFNRRHGLVGSCSRALQGHLGQIDRRVPALSWLSVHQSATRWRPARWLKARGTGKWSSCRAPPGSLAPTPGWLDTDGLLCLPHRPPSHRRAIDGLHDQTLPRVGRLQRFSRGQPGFCADGLARPRSVWATSDAVPSRMQAQAEPQRAGCTPDPRTQRRPLGCARLASSTSPSAMEIVPKALRQAPHDRWRDHDAVGATLTACRCHT
jgi:hypothetical protein